MTLDELARYDKPTLPVEVAFRALGWGRTSARQAIKRGTFPLRVIFLGRRQVVSTIELKRLVGLARDDSARRE